MDRAPRRVPAVPRSAALTVVIADDEPLARRGIRRLVAGFPGFRVVGEAETGAEAADAIGRLRPDIALVDIRMPDGSGLHAMARMPERDRPATVFVTAHEAHALEAFGVRAVDYVLKPFTDARLKSALVRAAEACRLKGLAADPHAAPPPAQQIVVRSVGKNDIVLASDIVWVDAAGYYVRLHTTGGELLHRESLESLAARLDPARFVRVHRSAIVRVDAIRQKRRRRSGGYELTLISGYRLPMSRAGWSALRTVLGAGATP